MINIKKQSTTFSEQNGKSQYLVTYLCKSFWETVLKFSLVIFWYIILGFLQYFPEFFD